MKKLTLILWLLLSATICTFAYDFKSGDLCYNITSDSTAEVTYQPGARYFDNYLGLTTAVIPESVTYENRTYSVTTIGGSAFAFCGLESITIPSSVTSIGDEAFLYCSGITSVIWNAKNVQIESYTHSSVSFL